jgi:hypothetical protein
MRMAYAGNMPALRPLVGALSGDFINGLPLRPRVVRASIDRPKGAAHNAAPCASFYAGHYVLPGVCISFGLIAEVWICVTKRSW